MTSPATRKVSRRRPQVKNEIVDWIKAIIVGVVLVNKLIYDFRDPKPSEVVVFHVRKEGRDFIKRVIGVAGDTIQYQGDNLYVNGKKVEESYIQGAVGFNRNNNER